MYRLAMCVFLVGSFPLAAQSPSTVLDAMKAELKREQAKLGSQPVPPYYIGYELTESHSAMVRGEFGGLINSNENRNRQLNIDVRVGDYALDNTREVRGEFNFGQYNSAPVPLDNDQDAIRAVLWHLTDQRYKQALERFTKVKTNVQVKVAAEDSSADFSREDPQQYFESISDVNFHRAIWEDKIRKYTAPFAKYTEYLSSYVVSTGRG